MSDRYQGRTTRGLNRVPPTRNSEPQKRRQTIEKSASQKQQRPPKQPKQRKIRKRAVKVRERFFGLGIGLDMQLLLLVLLLLGIGLSTLFSASYSYAYYYESSSFSYITKQGIFAALGIVCMLGISTLNYAKLKNFRYILLIITVLMLGIVLAFRGTYLVPRINGACRWLNLGGLSVQPSEIAKFTSILMISATLSKYDGKDVPFWKGVVPCFAWFGLFAVMVVLEPHVSATIIIAFICSAVMLAGGVKLRYFVTLIIPTGVVGGIYIIRSGKFSHVMPRILGWLNPFNPPDGIDTYQTTQSLYAIGSGGLFGTGIGQSRLKHLLLPEPQNDFVFAIFCEEMGLAGAIVVIVLFLWLVWRGINISLHAKDRFGTLLGTGITFTIGIQAASNICVVTNAFPNTGISLPFFSYGGSSLLVLLCEMGVLLSISRYNYRQDSLGIPEKTIE